MEFRDFKDNPKELIGKTVLYEYGQSYSPHKSRSINKIEKVTKTGFRISSLPDVLFSISDGGRKGLTGRSNMGTISRCSLITEEQAEQWRELWKRNRQERDLRTKMEEKLRTMTLEQLQLMDLI